MLISLSSDDCLQVLVILSLRAIVRIRSPGACRSSGVEAAADRSLGDGVEAHTIQEHALAIGTDLIVMGAYGRSRISEFIFDGMTREMLATGAIPVLMSR